MTGTAKPVVMEDRTKEQQRQFKFAMWEMTRLYAFGECEVIVDPVIDDADSFPGGRNAWGKVNTTRYEQRGWCCAECSVANANDRIINRSDPAVQDVLGAREWPSTVEAYDEMMSENAKVPVHFTNRGDKAAVLYNFFKMTHRCVSIRRPVVAHMPLPPTMIRSSHLMRARVLACCRPDSICHLPRGNRPFGIERDLLISRRVALPTRGAATARPAARTASAATRGASPTRVSAAHRRISTRTGSAQVYRAIVFLRH